MDSKTAKPAEVVHMIHKENEHLERAGWCQCTADREGSAEEAHLGRQCPEQNSGSVLLFNMSAFEPTRPLLDMIKTGLRGLWNFFSNPRFVPVSSHLSTMAGLTRDLLQRDCVEEQAEVPG